MCEPLIITRGTKGLNLVKGSDAFDHLLSIADKEVKCMDVSLDGTHLAYATANNMVRVVSLPSCDVVFEVSVNVNYVQLSPKANVLLVWHHFSGSSQNNLHLYGVHTGTLLAEMCQKKQSQCRLEWTADESVCVRHLNMELHFYLENAFNRYVTKLVAQKVVEYSLVTNKYNGNHYLSCYSTGVKGQPSFVKLYQYPKFEGIPVAHKSFYKADEVRFKWNQKGDAILCHCSTEIDQTGKSYYGQQSLHYLDLKGDTFIVTLGKDGPIHNVEWMPSAKESIFCVIYGFMPSLAALFNNKGDVVFQFGEPSMRNNISFNPFGSLVALGGFGNLKGGVQVWSLKERKLISEFKATDTTNISWCPNGVHIMTSTTAPRLRVGNGFRIWDYNGNCIYQNIFDTNTELYDCLWRPSSEFTEPVIKDAPKVVQTVKSQEPAKYVPPHLRTQQNASKSNTKAAKSTNAAPNPNPLSDREKKIKNLKKKLEQISKLKELQSSGKQLEKNQLEKITKEEELLDELSELNLN